MEKYKLKGKTKQVKCLICGAVFDASLDTCPVCGVGPELFVPFEEEEVIFSKDTDEIFLVIGNGAAGISAAEEIRKRNASCSIIIVSDEPVISYNRPMLTKALSTLTSADVIAIHDVDWYKQNNIINKLGLRADNIDSSTKTVTLSDGSLLKYDKCIYALGSECYIPPNLNSNKPEVVAIRRISDVKKIRKLIPKVKNTVVIGGGILGLEAAWEMSKSCHVTVLEVFEKLMARQLDDAAGDFLADIIRNKGINFILNAQIKRITGDSSVTGVELEDGTLFPADLVIISCGVRPNTALAREAGLSVGRGVIVNEKMETNVPDIYACGDCAYFQDTNYAIWPQALEMGIIAGANAAGDHIEYKLAPPALTFEGMDTSLYAAGDNGRNPNIKYKTKEVRDTAKGTYEKYFFVDNHLEGIILIGDTSRLVELTVALNEKLSYTEIL